jgi:hypothetical protein
MSKHEIKWLDEPEPHDYPAAHDYLRLIYMRQAEGLITWLRKAKVEHFKAKDLFRASALPLLDASNYHVKKDRKKIKNGVALSPLLLAEDNGHLIICDGYHRLCACYGFDEDAEIPCKIVLVP